MAERPDYAELVAQAEKAVAAVTDPELKRIAFQKILDDLLGRPAPQAEGRKPAAKKRVKSVEQTKRGPKGGPQTYVKELADEGFFKKPKTIANVRAELENRGRHILMICNSTRALTPRATRTLLSAASRRGAPVIAIVRRHFADRRRSEYSSIMRIATDKVVGGQVVIDGAPGERRTRLTGVRTYA